jgi:RNA polymerase sigma-70 factor (ECF subfamily)
VSDSAAIEFERIHDDYRDRVVAYATMLIGRNQAEDVAQTVFLKVSRSLDTLADPSRLTSWIFAITLNTVRDIARKGAVRAAFAAPPPASTGSAPADSPPDPFAQLPDPAARSPEENAVRNEMVACYVDYVNQLPREHYDVYVLSEFGGLANAAIARQLSLPVSTVKMRLHRARSRLHEMIRRNCRCYYSERGELMAEPAQPPRRRKGPQGRRS